LIGSIGAKEKRKVEGRKENVTINSGGRVSFIYFRLLAWPHFIRWIPALQFACITKMHPHAFAFFFVKNVPFAGVAIMRNEPQRTHTKDIARSKLLLKIVLVIKPRSKVS
jgi:hypothetical protein